MTPVVLQLPPLPNVQFVSKRGGPPARSNLLSFPGEKNPMDCPSGDQNGANAPSVPCSGLALSESMFRSHNLRTPPWLAVKTILLPSGERSNP